MGKQWDGTGVAFDPETWKEALRVLKPGGHLLAFGGTRTYHRMVCAIEDAGFEIRDQIGWVYGSGFPKSRNVSEMDMSGDDAATWAGWGTALKPAWEPIVVARKPLGKGLTVAANLLAYSTGAFNIEACRVTTDENLNGGAYSAERKPSESEWVAHGGTIHNSTGRDYVQPAGRWPANLIHDGSDEVLDAFPQAMGHVSASRFFYCAKASKTDREVGNNHPTVKPTELMRYLCRLVTPVGGIVLDPFMGSGSTGKAAELEGFRFVGIEREPAYLEIANARLSAVMNEKENPCC